MTNEQMHQRFLEFGERHGLLTGERLKLDIGMQDGAQAVQAVITRER